MSPHPPAWHTKAEVFLERTSAGLHEALRRGAVYRYDLLGYRSIPGDRKTGQLARVEIDEETAPLVRRIFTAVAAGTSLHALARQLNAEGIPTRRGAAMWRVGTLHVIIRNPLYTGRATHGRRRTTKTPGGAATTRPQRPGQGHVHRRAGHRLAGAGPGRPGHADAQESRHPAVVHERIVPPIPRRSPSQR